MVLKNFLLNPSEWTDYELLDSGDGMKRERWSDIILIRPEAAAYWQRKDLVAWEQYDGWFRSTSKSSHGSWHWKSSPPESWHVTYKNLRFLIRPTTSKQVGLFPEQASNWDWSTEQIRAAVDSGRSIKLLNLFGYTGAASIAAAAAGASVCHVDASKAMVSWCAENAALSNLNNALTKSPIRLIVDDCTKFLEREQRRGNRYDAIILDPPTFGRGSHGELWKIEDHLHILLQQCAEVLSDQPLFVLINSYSDLLSERALEQLVSQIFGNSQGNQIKLLPLGLQGTLDQMTIPCGLTARWKN